MKAIQSSNQKTIVSVLTLLLLLAGALNVQAATITNTASTTAITTGSAWLGGVAPGVGDIGLFDGTITGPLTTANAATAGSFGDLQFTNIGGPVTIGIANGSTITMNYATPTYTIDLSGATADVTLGAPGTTGFFRWASGVSGGISVTNGRTLTINANVSNAGNTKTITMTGGGNIIFNGASGTGSGGATGFSIQGGTTVTMNSPGGWGGASSKVVLNGTLNLGIDTALNGATLTLGGTSSTNPVVAATSSARTISSAITLVAVNSGNATITGTNNLTVNGLLTVSGGNRTLTVNSTGLTTFAGGVALADSATSRILTNNGTGNITISGNIANGSTATASALVYSGTGTLTLAGTNTYGGSTTISSGELVGVTGGSISNTAALIVAAGATNGVRLASVAGQFVVTNLVATNASFFDFNFNGFAPSLTTAPLQVLGNLATTNAVAFLVRNGTFGVGTYPLIKYTGTSSGTLTNLPTGLLPYRASGYLSNDVVTAKTIYLVVTNASAEPLTWAVGNGTWDTSTANWFDKFANAATYADPSFDQVVFDDTASGTSPITVTLNSTVTPVNLAANLTNKNYTISGSGGVIAGSGYLLKQGGGTLTLTPSSTWTYSGGITNAGGTIVLGNVLANNSACGTGPVTFNGGTLQLFDNGASTEAGPYTNAWIVPIGQTGSVSCPQRIGFTAASYFSSPLSGGGTFNFFPAYVRCMPSGDWTAFTGQVNISQRISGTTLMWNNPKGIPNAMVNLTNVSFGVWAAGTYPLGAVMGTNANLGVGNAASCTYLVGGANLSSVYDGTINGAVTIRKVGAGTWTLTGANTYTGNTLVSNGTLEVSGSLGATAVTNFAGTTLAGNAGTFAGGVDLEPGSTLAPGAAGAGNVGTLTFNGGLTLNGAVTNLLDVNSSANDTYVVASGQTLNIGSGGVVKLNIASLPADGSYTLIDHTGATLSGSVANLSLTPTTYGSSSLSLIDNGNQIQLQISTVGTNALTWATTGVAVNNYWDVGTSVNWTNHVGLDLETFLNGDSVTFDDSGAANSPVDVRSSVLPNGVVVNSSLDYVFTNTTGLGQISGTLTNGFVKSGSGSLTMLTKNNYTSSTLLNGSGVVTIGDGSTLNTAISSGPVTNNTLLVFNQPDNSAIAGDLTGTGSLVKKGAGILTVQGNATLTGTNLIDTGTLQLGNGGATAIPTNQFVLANGGTLALNRSGNYTITNTITGNGSAVFAGTATNVLGGTQSYLQNTYIKGGQLKLQANNIIPYAAGVAGSTGWLILDGGASTAGTLDLNGFDQTVNALSGLTGTVLGQITNSATGTGTNVLTVNSIFDTGYAGVIAENSTGAKVALVKNGAYAQTLTGVNTFSGGITVNSGVLGLGQAASVGTGMITLMSGTISNTVNFDLNAKNLTIPVGQSGILEMTTREKMPNLYGAGVLGVNVRATTAANSSQNFGDAPAASANFFGTLNCTGVVASAKLDLYINGGGTDGHFDNAIVNLDNLSLVGICGSSGSTAYFGTLNVHANASLDGSVYAGPLTYQVGVLNTDSYVDGNITGSSRITKVGSGKLILNGTDSYTGNTTINDGTLVVGSSSFMSSSPIITVSTNAILDVSAPSPTFSSQTLAGFGVVTGNVTIVNSFIIPGGSGVVGTLAFSNNLALTGTVTNTFDVPSSGANDQLVVAGTLDISGSGNVFNINALNGYVPAGTYTLATFNGPLLNGGSSVANGDVTNYVSLIGAVTGQTRNLTLSNSANAILLVVGAGSPLVWAGDGSANKWDITNSPDWTGPEVFYQLDSVTFNDSSANPTVNLTGTLAPVGITVNSASNYVFASTGKLTGNTGVSKSGSGTLTIGNTGGNDYSGTVTVSGGTLKAGVATALGSTNGSTVINGTGALDVGGFNLGAEFITVSNIGSGAGAILNSGAAALNALQNVTLNGDTTFGGPIRWDIRANPTGSLNGGGFNLTKVGTNDIYLVGLGNTALGNIQLTQGRIGVQDSTLLGASGTLALYPGAGLDFWLTTVTNTKSITLTNATISSGSGTNVFGGTISLNGTGTFTATTPLALTGSLGGSGSVLKLGASTLTLSGSSTYTGNTVISNGVLALAAGSSIATSTNLDVNSAAVLDVSGLSGGVLTLASSQTLLGSGKVNGSVTVAAGSTVAPGENAIGTLTVTNTITLAGNTVMEINPVGAPNCDLLTATNIQFGGTLTVTNINLANPPQLFDSFKVFKGAYSGSFATIHLPALGAGLVWSETLAVNGSITVAPASANADLTGIVLTPAGTLSPGFTTGVYIYSATNNNGDTPSVTVTNADLTATNTLFLNGISHGAITSSISSLPLALVVGSNNVTVQVVSQDLQVTNNYQVNVTRLPSAASSVGYLMNLVVSNNLNAVVGLTPGFTTNLPSGPYAATNTLPANQVNVTVTDVDPTATNTLFLNGGSPVLLSSGIPSSLLSLNAGSNNVMVQVVSQDLSVTNNYTVNVMNQPSQVPPKLTNSVSGSSLSLNWGPNYLGYRLLVQTNNLNKGVSKNISDWDTVAGSTLVTATNLPIIKVGVTNEYYRLVYP